MLEFSWNEWLRAVSSSKKRKPRVTRLPHIEGLENRALLTAPVALDDSGYVTNEDTILNGTSVLTNDTDVDGDIQSAVLDALPQHGQVTLNPDGTFVYTPDANFHGTDTFTYHAVDGTPEDSNVATVTITVDPVVDLTAVNDSFTTAQDAVLSDTVAANDATTSGGQLTYALDTQAQHGTAVVNSDGSFTYTPAAGYNGLDSFTYTVTDLSATESLTRTVSLKVGNNLPVANGGTASVDKNDVLNGTLTATDADQDPLTFLPGTITTQHGVLVILPTGDYTYTPTAGFVGQDSFSFKVNDGTADSADATITIDVINHAPTADPATPSTDEDTQLVGQLTGSDLDNDQLTFAAGLTAPAHGEVTIDPNGTYSYTPDDDFNGTDTFTFTVSDGIDTSIEATVTITVVSVNDAPVANVGTGSTTKGVAFNGTLTASDVDSDPLTFLAGQVTPTNGTVQINTDGSYTYTPNAGFDGQDMFSFKVNDTHTDSAEVLVTITVLNQAPTVNNGNGTTTEDTALTGSSVTGTDPDGDTLTFSVATQPAHGVLVLNANGTFTYTPEANFNGVDSFTFQATDGALNSNVGTFNLTVTPVEDVLTLTLTADPAEVAKDNVPVVLDPTASITDDDTTVNYANATITANITSGGDAKNDSLHVNSGVLTVKGKKILSGSTLIAKTAGGKKGKALEITFTEAATQEFVNAVLSQIAMATKKKGVSGARTVHVTVSAGGQTAEGDLTATVA